MKRPCRNASQTSIIKIRELHPIPLKTFNFNWMKRRVLLLVSTFMLSFFMVNAQYTNEGDKILNLGLGLGNSYYSGVGYSSTFPPVSASLEVIINDDIFNDGKGAIGVGGYAGFFGYKYDYAYFNSKYDWKYSNIAIGPRGYLHYSFIDKLDTYTGLMLGYNIVSVKGGGNNVVGYTASSSGFIYSWFLGGRYYFNDNFAGMLELGYGIAYLNIGVAMKF